MARLKSKQFKKKYSSSMKNVTGKGVWSGRGIGIPVAGAIGGGDDYKQKIGRGKIPYYHGNAGTPSQGADSTFSSYLARVNTGYDEYDGDVMFPEQEAEESDIYYWDDPEPVVSRKMPRNFKVMRPKTTSIREAIFKDGDIVKNSRYSVSRLFEVIDGDAVGDIGVPLNIDAPRLKDTVTDILGDALLALCDTATGDICGLVAVIPAVSTNLYQIHSATKRGEELLEEYSQNPSDDVIRSMDDAQHDIIRDTIDIVQRILEASPFVGEEWLSFAGGKVSQQVLQQAIASAAASGVKSFAETYKDFINSVPKAVRFLLEFGSGGPIGRIVSRGIEVCGMMHQATREHIEFRQGGSQVAQLQPDVGIESLQPVESGEQRFNKEDIYRAILTGELAGEEPIQMSELKNFIRESIYPDYMSYHEAQPTGYEYRRVPTITSKEAESQEFETLDDYSDFSVAYKSDGGVVSYQDRNKILKERALRLAIRRRILSIMEESKKKRNSF